MAEPALHWHLCLNLFCLADDIITYPPCDRLRIGSNPCLHPVLGVFVVVLFEFWQFIHGEPEVVAPVRFRDDGRCPRIGMSPTKIRPCLQVALWSRDLES